LGHLKFLILTAKTKTYPAASTPVWLPVWYFNFDSISRNAARMSHGVVAQAAASEPRKRK